MSRSDASSVDAPTNLSERHVVEWRCESLLPLLADHFPGKPIVPAYYQLAHICSLVSQWLGVVVGRVSMKSMKFLHPIEPGQVVFIVLERKPAKSAVSITLSVDDRVVTQGDVGIE